MPNSVTPEHAGEHRHAQRPPHLRPGPLGDHQRHHAEDEREADVIRIGRSRSRHASSVACAGASPGLVPLLGELDDQDGVLARQADQHDEADLREDR